MVNLPHLDYHTQRFEQVRRRKWKMSSLAHVPVPLRDAIKPEEDRSLMIMGDDIEQQTYKETLLRNTTYVTWEKSTRYYSSCAHSGGRHYVSSVQCHHFRAGQNQLFRNRVRVAQFARNFDRLFENILYYLGFKMSLFLSLSRSFLYQHTCCIFEFESVTFISAQAIPSFCSMSIFFFLTLTFLLLLLFLPETLPLFIRSSREPKISFRLSWEVSATVRDIYRLCGIFQMKIFGFCLFWETDRDGRFEGGDGRMCRF